MPAAPDMRLLGTAEDLAAGLAALDALRPDVRLGLVSD